MAHLKNHKKENILGYDKENARRDFRFSKFPF